MKLKQKIKSLDLKIAYFFPKFYHHHILNNFIKFISSIGDFGMIWLVLILILTLSPQTEQIAQKMLTALLLATVIGQVTIKSVIRRKRPCHSYDDIKMLVPIPNDFSFPSGHTASCFACATTVCFFYPYAGIGLILFSILMGFSRIYLFVHYFSDVIAGMLLGIIVGSIVALI